MFLHILHKKIWCLYRMPPVRSEKRLLADRRAMEEQVEREADMNPAKSGGRRRKAPEPKEESEDEIVGYGRLLSQHIMNMHGGAFHKSFLSGMSAYGNPGVAATPVGFDNLVEEKAKKPLLGRPRKGAGPLEIEIKHMGHASESDEEKHGGALTGRYEGEGKQDKRKIRAALVKKVMAEQGCSLPVASKYVKEHNLM